MNENKMFEKLIHPPNQFFNFCYKLNHFNNICYIFTDVMQRLIL